MKFLIKYLRRRKIAKLAEKLYLSDSSITYEEAIDQLYGFVKKNRIIGCVYDW